MIEWDELWSFVGNKQNQQWVWLALDRASKDIVGCLMGSRDESGAIGLWQSLPDCSLDAQTYTDFWEAYDAICYHKTLHRVAKETALTILWNASTTPRATELLVESEKRCPSPRNLTTPLGLFGISSTTTTPRTLPQHYLLRTT